MDQCIDIINLTSLDWPEEGRYSLVGHSFRVMAKAGNHDEMIVGLMHALYAASSFTRRLYHCDVWGDPEWKTALDLFVPPLKIKRFRSKDTIPDEYLLSLNMPQNLSESDRQSWMLEQTCQSQEYSEYIGRISDNRIARNVMIHKLEDILDVLERPGKYEDESGPQFYVLPWKKHQVVGVPMGRSTIAQTRIPDTDDALLLRNLTEEERGNLIEKYDWTLEKLQWTNESHPVMKDFTFWEREQNEEHCHQCFLDWMSHQKYLKEIGGGKDEESECESEDLSF